MEGGCGGDRINEIRPRPTLYFWSRDLLEEGLGDLPFLFFGLLFLQRHEMRVTRMVAGMVLPSFRACEINRLFFRDRLSFLDVFFILEELFQLRLDVRFFRHHFKNLLM